MSSVPTGSAAPSIWAILAASRCASVTPRVRRPTKATSEAPPFFSRISWAMRVRARSSAASSRTWAFSRKRGTGEAIFSPYGPLGDRLKERRERLPSLYTRGSVAVNRLAPRAEEIERKEREGAQHQERAGAEHEATEGLGPVEQTRHPEEVVPVVDEPVGEQRQRHRAPVGRVDRDVGERLPRPEECDRGGGALPRAQEGHDADRGDQDLVQRAAQHRDEAPEEAEDQVARLVEDEVHTVEERAGPARGERQALAENSECDPEEEQEADGAAGDPGHQSASVATTGAWSEGFVPLRSSRSISTAWQRAASAGVSRMWSIRSPQPRRKAPARYSHQAKRPPS